MYSKSDYKIALGNSTDLTPSDIKRVALRYNCSLPIEPSTTTSAQPATTTAAQPSTTPYSEATSANPTTPTVDATTAAATLTRDLNISTMSTESYITSTTEITKTSVVTRILTTEFGVTTTTETKFSDLSWNNLWPSWLQNQKFTNINSHSTVLKPSIISTFFIFFSSTFHL